MVTIFITKESMKITVESPEDKPDCGEPRGKILSVESPEDKPICGAKRKMKVPITGKPRGNMKDPDCGEPRGKILSVESPEDKIKPPDKGQIQLVKRKNKNEE